MSDDDGVFAWWLMLRKASTWRSQCRWENDAISTASRRSMLYTNDKESESESNASAPESTVRLNWWNDYGLSVCGKTQLEF